MADTIVLDADRRCFPRLGARRLSITSQIDKRYNCIAYAASDLANWWWPFPADAKEVHWPTGVPREETVNAFRAMFESLGYAECSDDLMEAGFEKVALFAEGDIPRHAARQRENGRWISELGEREDIEHDLRDLEGDTYGTVVLIMKRSRTP